MSKFKSGYILCAVLFCLSCLACIFGVSWDLSASFGLTQTIPLSGFSAEKGFNCIAHLPDARWSSEDGPSLARVFENGKPLEYGNVAHDDIRSKGHGRFSFWGNNVYFSSSDGSDPLTNGYVYVTKGPLLLPSIFWPLDISILILSGAILIIIYRDAARTSFAWISAHTADVLSSSSASVLFYVLSIALLLSALLMVINPSIRCKELSTPGSLPFIFVYTLTVGLCLFLPRRVRIVMVISLVVSGLIVFLSMVWASHSTYGFLLGGIVPYSDASGYYHEASRLAEGSNLTGWGTRRPLIGAFWAAILFISRHSLPVANLIMVVMTSIALAFLILEIREYVGVSPAAVVLFICVVFYSRFVGSVTSEAWGLLLGSLALTFLIRGVSTQQMWISFAGLFTLTLALNVRAGAFFVLPAIVVALALGPGLGGVMQRFRMLLLAVGSVIMGFLANSIFGRILGAKGGLPFANFSYTLYGLVFGGNWSTAYSVPQFANLPEREQALRIYHVVWQTIRAHPQLLMKGIWRALKGYLFLTPDAYGPFVFAGQKGVEYFLQVAFFAGILWSIAKARKNSLSLLLTLATLGIILSVPFAPPWDADMMRAYAATIPLLALIPGIFFCESSRFLRGVFLKEPSAHPLSLEACRKRGGSFVIIYWGFIMILILILPFISRFVLKTKPLASISDIPGSREKILKVNLYEGNYIKLVDNITTSSTWHDIPITEFKSRLSGISDFFRKDAVLLKNVAKPGTIIFTPGNDVLCIINSARLSSHKGAAEIKGRSYRGNGRYFVDDSVDTK